MITKRQITFDDIHNIQPGNDGLVDLPLVVLTDQVLLPNSLMPVKPRNDANRRAIQQGISHQQTVMAVKAIHTETDSDSNTQESQEYERVGTEIAVIEMPPLRYSRESINLLAQGRQRLEIIDILQVTPFPVVRARPFIAEQDANDSDFPQVLRSVLDLFEHLVDLNLLIPDEVAQLVTQTKEPQELGDLIAATLDLSADESQTLLSERNLKKRFEFLLVYLSREINAQEIRDEVETTVNSEMARIQREAYLREQMRVIQSELGETDYLYDELEALRQNILSAKMTAEAEGKAMAELQRLATMPPMSPEASVIRTYLEWLTELPWTKRTRDRLNLLSAERTLAQKHYGLKKVKDRILEHIAVRKLAGDKMNNPILCFVGPPGVGKTSLGQSIATALGREFVRVSLGGVRDEAEIRGHRRTYIGALPGRIIQTMKRAGTINPVFMLDEIDKLSADYRGDPAAALLEVLDPEQNNQFSDHYLEVSYDLSNVLFITTANELYPLPEALEDRLEVIEFRAYTEDEKLEIARQFLLPKQLSAHGLTRRGIRFQSDALLTIIRHYTLEAGVRNLEREIGNICRKITRLVATNRTYPKRITPGLVEKYLGPPYILETRVNQQDYVGLVTGLVWTSNGGDIQLIEASLLPGKGSLMLTGQLGDVLQESAQTAMSYMRSQATRLDVPHDDFENYDIHIHMPEGSVPKDGPSAGITLATAIISAFTERAIRHDFAMTGEVTLRGHVLPVGGVKEKVLAAHRHRIANVILPADNKKDLIDIPKQAIKNLKIHFVDHMNQVIDLVLLEAPEQRQRDLEAEQQSDNDNSSQDECDE